MSLPILTLLIIASYFLVLLLISRITSSRADNSTFFIGNRSMPWTAVVLAMITAPISGVTFISVPGMVLSKGYGYLQMCLGFIIGYFIIALVLIPLYYKNKIFSIYSFLEDRFGKEAYKTAAWFFVISKCLSTAVKFLVVCLVLQVLVFEPLGFPFIINVILTMTLICLYTINGGVKTVIWTDMFKSLVLVVSISLCAFFIIDHFNLTFHEITTEIRQHPTTQFLFLDNPYEGSYFWKQVIAGIFLVIAMTGLDQDMMQHTLSLKNEKKAKNNLYLSAFLQFGVIALFLFLGSLLILFMEHHQIDAPVKTDDLFATLAFHREMPLIVGILFILGLISASYSSVGSALTSLTTSFTIDIMDIRKKFNDKNMAVQRKKIHILISLALILLIIGFYYLNREDAISAVYTLASYTYGPILGLFLFAIFTKKQINGRRVGIVCFMAPVLAWIVQWIVNKVWGYETGYELLLINAGIIFIGLWFLPATVSNKNYEKTEII